MMKPFRILGKGVQDVWLNKHGFHIHPHREIKKCLPFGIGNPYFQASGMPLVELRKIEFFFQNLSKIDTLLYVFYPLLFLVLPED